MNTLYSRMRRLIGMAVNPAFRVDAISRYAMAHAVPVGVRDDYPCLEAKHFDNPILFSIRNDMISSVQCVKGGVIAEVGVARGDFSEYLLNQLSPRKFVAFDILRMHENRFLGWGPWGRGVQSKVAFNNSTHLDYHKRRFSNRGTQVMVEVGKGDIHLSEHPDTSFDFIYIDADHSYESVKRDANVARVKLTDNGILVFNDYIMFDHLNGSHYGIVQAVNELIVSESWRVCGFALHKHMFCDIAIRKRSGLPL